MLLYINLWAANVLPTDTTIRAAEVPPVHRGTDTLLLLRSACSQFYRIASFGVQQMEEFKLQQYDSSCLRVEYKSGKSFIKPTLSSAFHYSLPVTLCTEHGSLNCNHKS